MKTIPAILSRDRLTQVLKACSNLSTGVVGDLALDAYWYAEMTRSILSRETPLFPRPIVREVYLPGAGANVAQNLKCLGTGRVAVFSILGSDWRGEILKGEMNKRGIDTQHVLTTGERCTNTYIKPMLTGYASQQEDARLDFENDAPLTQAMEEQLMETIRSQIDGLDALLAADQIETNGIITGRMRAFLNELAGEYPQKTFLVDSRRHIGDYRNMVLKPNRMEALAAVTQGTDDRAMNDEDRLTQAGMELSQRCRRPVFMTLSEQGVLVVDGKAGQLLPAAPVRPPLDPVGAGDAFIAALAVSLASGANPLEAGAFANLAAAVTVEKLNQTGTASPEEIYARYEMSIE
ncbi:MAG: bifunctional heptose 7-phosphate kinase/heptose 1-phosphate adenyltransferase [Omnitrophica WOR_2 bacterium]